MSECQPLVIVHKKEGEIRMEVNQLKVSANPLASTRTGSITIAHTILDGLYLNGTVVHTPCLLWKNENFLLEMFDLELRGMTQFNICFKINNSPLE